MNRRFLAILIILSSAFLFATDGKPETYLEDHSDWWSLLNESLLDRQLQPREKEMDPTSFAIAGITLDDDPLPQAMPKLGQATPVSRGDAATGRSQSCYVSSSGSRKTYLIFERGEVEYSFYLFTGGADWTGSNVCAKSRVELSDLSTPSGLKLGLSRAELESILGKPDLTEGNKIIW